jgi:hypothetical protein
MLFFGPDPNTKDWPKQSGQMLSNVLGSSPIKSHEPNEPLNVCFSAVFYYHLYNLYNY